MIHSDILNSLTNSEKVTLLACMQHVTGKEYKYEELQWIRKPFFRDVLQRYYKIVKKDQKKVYKQMVEKINSQRKLL